MVAPMLDRLFELAMQDGHKPAAVNAARDMLDRAGIGTLVEAKVRTSQREDAGRIVVNIGFLTPLGNSDVVVARPVEDGAAMDEASRGTRSRKR